MRTRKRLVLKSVIGISMFICLAGLLSHPSDSQAGGYAILHNFVGGPDDGWAPYYGGPVFSGGALYGMTQGGRSGPGPPPYNYSGTLYKINPDGTGYQILHDFINDPPTGDGTSPRGSLTLSGSTLYGCTPYGGRPYIQSGGTVFKIDTNGGGYQVLYTFPPGDTLNPTQVHPYAAPVVSGSTLYGTTSSESTSLCGEIFAMSTSGGPPAVLHEFAGKPNDGAQPYGSLTLVGSTLYGMTSTGGHNGIDTGGSGNGVIFKINTNGTGYQVLHHFGDVANDGAHPNGSLTLVGSKLYGMTAEGGPLGGGVIFSMDPNGNNYQVLFDFYSVSLAGPRGSLTLRQGKLYGTARWGGAGGGNGGVFRINPDGTGCQVLHIFKADQGDGGDPLGDVTFVGARLFGWTYAGGANGNGVFFSLQVPQSDTAMMELLLLQ